MFECVCNESMSCVCPVRSCVVRPVCVVFEAGGVWWRVELSYILGGSREGEQSFSHRTVDMAVSNNITRWSHIYPTLNSSICICFVYM